MSRNLCQTDCRRCGSVVKIVGPIHRLPNDHWARPSMLVADADCTICSARYTAWVGPASEDGAHNAGYGARREDVRTAAEHGFYDLSFRQSFNDEPGEGDLPDVGKIEVARVVTIDGRVASWEPST